MPNTGIDEELAEGLSQAKKKPRHFCLIAKGVNPLKLIVQKKPVKDGDVLKAKTETKGNLAVQGVCVFDQGEMTFQVVGEDPGIKALALKTLVSEQAEMNLKVKFAVVTTLATVDESDDENSATPTSSKGAPPPPPPPPPPPDTGLTGPLVAALNKIAPAIKTALESYPDRKAEISKLVGEVQTHIKTIPGTPEKDRPQLVAAAKDRLTDLAKLLKGLSTPGTASTEKPAPVQNEVAQEATQTTTPIASTAEAEEFAQRLAAIEPNYLRVLRDNPENAGQLRAVLDFANGNAEQLQYAKALAALTRLEKMVEDTAAALLAAEIDAQIDDEDEQRGVVAFRKALLRWDAARSQAEQVVAEVKLLAGTKYPTADVDRLDEIFDVIDNSLHDALIDCINAEDEEDRRIYSRTVRESISTLREKIGTNDLISGIDRNPFRTGTRLGDELRKSLDEVESYFEAK